MPTLTRSFLRDPSSFRDPSGFVFRGEDGQLYRQVNHGYEADYRQLMADGLYRDLVEAGLLVEHDEAPLSRRLTEAAAAVLRPRCVEFISYPYEWCFTALKAAALLTLDLQRRALRHGMSLKDASAYNVQFEGVRPVFIDTLSFERYQPGRPWVAYGQLCRHFLAPLALMARTDIRLNRLLASHLDGVPLDLAARLLPWRTRLRPGLFLHLHLHSWSLQRHADTSEPKGLRGAPSLRPQALDRLLDSLERTVEGLSWRPAGTEWADYYASHSYTSAALDQKKRFVAESLEQAAPRTVWDLGANTGLFSQLAAERGANVMSFDIDPACVEMNFHTCRERRIERVLPLCLDLTNPTPSLGWAHEERSSLAERGPADVVLALALVHHLAISNNVPFDRIAGFLPRLGRHVIVEYVPKDDPQVQRLLRSRTDIFCDYTVETFEAALGRFFRVRSRQALPESGRVLYFLETCRPG
jgi:ribosomal protein L11 methylase PrmA